MQMGMVGLGRMGANMVRRLIGDGHECVVYDVRPESVAELEQAGASGADSLEAFVGKLTAPPAVVGLLPASQAPVQLASAATPLSAGESGLPMLPPIMPPPISPAGSGWRKRKQQKYEDIAIGAELKGNVMRPPPSAG